MREDGADISSGAVQVVGQALDVDGNACRAIAFVRDLLVHDSLGARAEGLVDSSLNLRVRHGNHAGTGDCCSKGSVVCGVRVSAGTGCDGDVAGMLGEERRTLCVDCGLLVLRGSPLRVSGHAHLLLDWQNIQIIQKQG